MNKNAKIIKTSDGSDTLYLPDMNEHYHSIHGARQESEHVYIRMGWDHFFATHPEAHHIDILEVGFGTGLNALLTLIEHAKRKVTVSYHTLEPYPLPHDLVQQLEFGFTPTEKNVYLALHKAEWGEEIELDKGFYITKFQERLEDFSPPKSYDLVYFDAFAPNKQEEIWSSGNLLKLKSVLSERQGDLVTYCAQGKFKRSAKEAGFEVVSLPGPPRKNEMIRLTLV